MRPYKNRWILNANACCWFKCVDTCHMCVWWIAKTMQSTSLLMCAKTFPILHKGNYMLIQILSLYYFPKLLCTLQEIVKVHNTLANCSSRLISQQLPGLLFLVQKCYLVKVKNESFPLMSKTPLVFHLKWGGGESLPFLNDYFQLQNKLTNKIERKSEWMVCGEIHLKRKNKET
jgi:hypothetical protein